MSRFYASKPGAASTLPTPRVPGPAGRPLPDGLRASLEPSFRHDFSRVRVHSDAEAAAAARSAGAPALTIGRDIMLGAGTLDDEPARARRVIAHELAHVVQSERGGSPAGVAEAEDEARGAGEAAAAGRPAAVRLTAPSGSALCAPPQLDRPRFGQGLGWKPAELDTTWYTMDEFDTGESVLKPAHEGVIDDVIKALARDPLRGGFITVIGYADAVGTRPDNKVLGQQRADAVRAALIDKGVSPDDVRAGSVGEDVLAVDTQKAEGKNRRVQIVVRRRRLSLGLGMPTPGPKIGGGAAPVKTDAQGQGARTGTTGPGTPGPVDVFKQGVIDLAEKQGAKKDTPFDDAVKYLAENASKDVAGDIADLAQKVGVDRRKAKEAVEKGIEKGMEAGLKEALKTIIGLIAGPPSERPAFDTGPPVFEQKKPMIFTVPLPLPGDAPAPANVNNPTLTVTDKLSANLTKLKYKPGEFISFRFTTPASFGQLPAVVEIVPAGGGEALRSMTINGRRSGSESLAVPESAGTYVLQVTLRGESPHPRGMFRFSVE